MHGSYLRWTWGDADRTVVRVWDGEMEREGDARKTGDERMTGDAW